MTRLLRGPPSTVLAEGGDLHPSHGHGSMTAQDAEKGGTLQHFIVHGVYRKRERASHRDDLSHCLWPSKKGNGVTVRANKRSHFGA